MRRLEEWLAGAAALRRLLAVELLHDSHNDLPLLGVSRPVAVDPDAQLAALARGRGWEVISLRG